MPTSGVAKIKPPAPGGSARHRVVWFLTLWLAGVFALGVAGGVIKLLLR